MTKAEIIVNISEKTGVEKIVVASIVEGFMSEVKSNVIDNKSIFLRGFGTFKPKKRARKIGRNIKKMLQLLYLNILSLLLNQLNLLLIKLKIGKSLFTNNILDARR